MKHSLLLSLTLTVMAASTAFGQVLIDKSLNLTGATPADSRIMGIKEVSAAQDAVSAEVLQKGGLTYASVTGGPNTYTLTLSPAVSAPYSEGMVILFKANGDNTTAVMLNGIPLRKDVSSPLDAGDIKNNQIVTVVYDGANFQLASRTADSNSGGSVTSVSTAAANNGVTATWTNPTTTPALTIGLGAITPSSISTAGNIATTGGNITASGNITATGTISGSNFSGTHSGGSSGTNTGDQSLSGLGGVPSTRTISTTAPLTGGGDLSADRTLGITQATTSSNGYLSSADWNTFNSKESALTFSNGLTRNTNAITWGGSLTGNTTIAQTDKTVAFTSTVTNSFSVDGTTFSVDAANNRVGIGTAAPSHPLTVVANGQSNAAIGARGAGANTFEWGHGNTAGYGNAVGYQNGNGHPFIAFNAEAGTTNNTYRTRGVVGTVIKGDLAGGLSINSVTTAAADNQSLSPLVTVLGSGYVGIGSAATNPDRPLTVVNGTEWNIASRSTNATSTNRNHILFQRANSASAVSAGFNLGGIAMGGYDGSAYSSGWNGGAEISAFANQTFTSTARGTYLSLSTTPDNTASIKEQMRIGADGIISLTTGTNNIRGYFRAVESSEYNGANGGSGFVIATSGGETLTLKDGGIGGDVNLSINGAGTVTIPSLGASGNVPVYADNSGNLFKGPAAGSVVQMKAIQTRTQGPIRPPSQEMALK